MIARASGSIGPHDVDVGLEARRAPLDDHAAALGRARPLAERHARARQRRCAAPASRRAAPAGRTPCPRCARGGDLESAPRAQRRRAVEPGDDPARLAGQRSARRRRPPARGASSTRRAERPRRGRRRRAASAASASPCCRDRLGRRCRSRRSDRRPRARQPACERRPASSTLDALGLRAASRAAAATNVLRPRATRGEARSSHVRSTSGSGCSRSVQLDEHAERAERADQQLGHVVARHRLHDLARRPR